MAQDLGLAQSGAKTVEALAADLVAAHTYLTDPARSGLLGYLYRKQIERAKK